MREIQFQLINLDHEFGEVLESKNIFYDEWIRYTKDESGGVWEEVISINELDRDYVDALIKREYIGFKDAAGKKIFEGDIIKTDESIWLVEPINSEEKDEDNFGLCVSLNGDGDNYFLDRSILKGRIIGNVYENSEILNK